MEKLKKIVKKIPVIPSVYRVLRDNYIRYRLKSKNTVDIFNEIYEKNKWHGDESVSGRGSDIDQTRVIAQEIPNIITEFDISTMLDIPCGDFHWMKDVDLHEIEYLGADIVETLIRKNNEKYTNQHIRFKHMDLIKDSLPKVDIVFCRDCLVHFSSEDVFSALDNICSSQSEYLLTTTFTERKDNCEIATGQFRTLNLQAPPFGFPKPLKIIHEECTESNNAYRDKALGLWRIADIRENLMAREKEYHKAVD